MADGSTPRNMLMSRTEWDRTSDIRAALTKETLDAWWALTPAEADEAVRTEERRPGTGAAFVREIAAGRPGAI